MILGFLSFVYLFWRNVYAGPLAVFKVGYLLLPGCRDSSYILELDPYQNAELQESSPTLLGVFVLS